MQALSHLSHIKLSLFIDTVQDRQCTLFIDRWVAGHRIRIMYIHQQNSRLVIRRINARISLQQSGHCPFKDHQIWLIHGY